MTLSDHKFQLLHFPINRLPYSDTEGWHLGHVWNITKWVTHTVSSSSFREINHSRWGKAWNQGWLWFCVSHTSYSFLSLLGDSVCQQVPLIIYFHCTQVHNLLWTDFLLFLLAKEKSCWSHVEVLALMIFTVFTEHQEQDDWIFTFWQRDLLPSLFLLLSLFSRLPSGHTIFSTPLYWDHLFTSRYEPKSLLTILEQLQSTRLRLFPYDNEMKTLLTVIQIWAAFECMTWFLKPRVLNPDSSAWAWVSKYKLLMF